LTVGIALGCAGVYSTGTTVALSSFSSGCRATITGSGGSVKDGGGGTPLDGRKRIQASQEDSCVLNRELLAFWQFILYPVVEAERGFSMMDYEKTGRLIRKKRESKNLTQALLSIKLGATPQAISLWEKGKRFPDATAQIMIFKELGLNPVELITGLEMFDDELKNGIAAYMRRIDEKVFVAGMVKDEDGNEEYLDLSDFEVVATGKNGQVSVTWIPYTEYYNVEPAPKREEPDALPLSAYNPERVYINHYDAIFVIPVEILEEMGKPLFFTIIRNDEDGWVGFRFTDEMEDEGFDIQPDTYNGEWKGVHILGGDFGRMLCKQMGIRRQRDLIEIEPEFFTEQRAVILFLDRAKRVNVDMDYSRFTLPQWQYNEFWAEEECDDGEECDDEEDSIEYD
jgi:transcriptional regulator with XRE-family HTH domain